MNLSSGFLFKINWRPIFALHKNWSFPLRISSVNATKSAGNCGFGQITEETLNGKFHLLCSVGKVIRCSTLQVWAG